MIGKVIISREVTFHEAKRWNFKLDSSGAPIFKVEEESDHEDEDSPVITEHNTILAPEETHEEETGEGSSGLR